MRVKITATNIKFREHAELTAATIPPWLNEINRKFRFYGKPPLLDVR